MNKVSIIGAGNVGASLCEQLALSSLCQSISLVDIYEDVAKAKAEDISQLCATFDIKCRVDGGKNYELIEDSNIVVVTAGSPRKEGQSRDDLLLINAKITKRIAKNIALFAPNSIIIQVSNPLDAMVYVALKHSGFDRCKVLGMAGVLDGARLKYQIQQKVGLKDVQTMVLGGHGDDMVAVLSQCRLDGELLENVFSQKQLEDVMEKTKHGGVSIVKKLGTSAYYAPAAGTLKMIKAILNDTCENMECAILLDGEYGYKNVVSGVPVSLGKDGAKKIIELELNDKEKDEFSKSVNGVYNLLEVLEQNEY